MHPTTVYLESSAVKRGTMEARKRNWLETCLIRAIAVSYTRLRLGVGLTLAIWGRMEWYARADSDFSAYVDTPNTLDKLKQCGALPSSVA